MAIKALRVFYRNSDSEVIWYHALEGPGVFPTTIDEDLAEIPDKITTYVADADGKLTQPVKVGGVVTDHSALEVTDPDTIRLFFSPGRKQVRDGRLIPLG